MNGNRPQQSIPAPLAELLVTCITYAIIYYLQGFPGWEVWAWFGGGFCFLLTGLMIGSTFSNIHPIGAFWLSSGITGIIMLKLLPVFSILMGIIFVIVLIIIIADYFNQQNNRRDQWN